MRLKKGLSLALAAAAAFSATQSAYVISASAAEEDQHIDLYLSYALEEIKDENIKYTPDKLDLSALWDTDQLYCKIIYLKENVAPDTSEPSGVKVYFSSKTGAFEDMLIEEFAVDDLIEYTIDIGKLRDKFDNNLFSDARIKFVYTGRAYPNYYLQVQSSEDEVAYDRWSTETDNYGREVQVFYARNFTSQSDCDFRNYYNVGDYSGKFVYGDTIFIEIEGNATVYYYRDFEESQDFYSRDISESNALAWAPCRTDFTGDVGTFVYTAERGAKITVIDFIYAIDYAGDIDRTLDTTKPVDLPNQARDIYYEHYSDVSFIKPTAGRFTLTVAAADHDRNLVFRNANFSLEKSVTLPAGETVATIDVTAEEMELLRKYIVQIFNTDWEDGLNSESLTFVATDDKEYIPEPDWGYGENPCEITLDSGREYLYIPGTAFSDLTSEDSSPVTVNFTVDENASDPSIQYRYGTTDPRKSIFANNP